MNSTEAYQYILLEPSVLTQIRNPPRCSFVGKQLETTQMSNFYSLSQYNMIRFNHFNRKSIIPYRISHPSSTTEPPSLEFGPAQRKSHDVGMAIELASTRRLDDFWIPRNLRPAERTPKKPEYLIARSQLP